MKIEISRVYTHELLALCHVFDKYEEFLTDLNELLNKSKKEIDTIYNLEQLSHGKFGIYSRTLKEFYEKHKEIIDEINKYSHIHTFICQAHTWNEETSIYYYLKSHKEDIPNIIKTIERLISLGIFEIEFSEKFDFTKQVNKMNIRLRDNSYIHFYENMEVIPSYNSDSIKYRTTSSAYDIELKAERNDVEFCTIQLNSLNFDPERLPKKISKEETTDQIISLKEKRQKDYEMIKSLINLRIANHSSVLSFLKLELEMRKLDSLSSKEELLESMKKTRDGLEQIINANKQYELEVITNSDFITEELLDKEEQEYQGSVMSQVIHIM